MKQFITLSSIVAVLLLSVFTSCEYDYIEPVKFNPPDTIENDTISFAQDVLPFFASDCESCHKGTIVPDLRANMAYAALTSGNYVVADKPAESEIYTICLSGGTMERYVNSTTGLSYLYRWIAAGAKNN
jgi:hypothetical protein